MSKTLAPGWTDRIASVKGGSVESSKEIHAGDRRMLLKSSPKIEKAQARIPGGGGAVKPTSEEKLPG